MKGQAAPADPRGGLSRSLIPLFFSDPFCTAFGRPEEAAAMTLELRWKPVLRRGALVIALTSLLAAPGTVPTLAESRVSAAPEPQVGSPAPWPGEELAGGETTVFDDSPSAFGRALSNLDRGRWLAMRAGKRLFEIPWQDPAEAPETAPRRGLGPLHNATACTDCHFRDGRGGPPPASARTQPGPPTLTPPPVLAKLSLPAGALGGDLGGGPDPLYGEQLNDLAVGLAPEGRLVIEHERVTYEQLAAEQLAYQQVTAGPGPALLRPRPRIEGLDRGPLHPQVRTSLRIPPTLIGLGLLEAVPDSRLEALADPEDRDGDGISGRVQRVPLEGREEGKGAATAIGRFGWKAGQATIEDQVAKAFHQDLGVTSPLYPEPNCPAGDEACRNAHRSQGQPGVELPEEDLALVALYTRLLAPPARRDWQDAEVLAGREAFLAVGCGSCHLPQLETASWAPGSGILPELAGQTIRPYTDLLLHDMGTELDDGVAEHGASSSEWRTPPLWGLGLLERVNGHVRLLHDGRARSFEEAILWHGGEADGSRQAYVRLPAEERSALLRFLRSL